MLDTSSWEFFLLNRICSIDMGNKMDFSAMSMKNPSVNFVGRSEENNGVMGKVDLIDGVAPYPAGSLTVALGGSLGSTFLQTDPFYTSQNVSVLSFDENEVPPLARLFLASMVHFESRFKYFPFGRELNKYLRTVYGFDLPVKRDGLGKPVIDPSKRFHNEGYIPDWQHMEDFIRGLDHQRISTANSVKPVSSLPVSEFVDFAFGNMIDDIHKAKANKKDDLVEVPVAQSCDVKTIRYITRTAENNGCEMFVSRAPEIESGVESGNAITIGDTTATCFYQDEEFIAGDHMVVIRADWLNPFTGLFVTTLLSCEAYRYSYGRAFIMNSIKATTLKLPVQRDSIGVPIVDPSRRFHTEGYLPDWEFMENYIRSLPYGDRIPEQGSSHVGAGVD